MTSESKQLILRALEAYRGDDYWRAQAAFRIFTLTQMQEQHGLSGHTRQEILDAYRKHHAAVDRAVGEFNQVVKL